jgi:hypothetical protein
MKKFLAIAFITFLSLNAQAKKVKFLVGMGTDSVSVFGMHVMGTFQDTIGVGNDFVSNTCPLVNEGGSWYAYYADMPANNLYEYIFINGDQLYEVEIVPFESRVDYDIVTGVNSNRWFYLDSTKNDTTIIGGFKFGTNAPAGKKIFRTVMDAKYQNFSTLLPTIGGTYNSFANNAHTMFSFKPNLYEAYSYVDSGLVEWATWYPNKSKEVINNTACINASGNRLTLVNQDFILDTTCFTQCEGCFALDLDKRNKNITVMVYPNPSTDIVTIKATDIFDINIFDYSGKLIYANTNNKQYTLNTMQWVAGIYIVQANGINYKLVKQ